MRLVCLALFLGALNSLTSPAVVAAPEKMKAIVLHEYGGVDKLRYEDAPRPEPRDDEVLIRVMAASVNPVDAAIRSGKFAQFFHTSLPLIPGMDAAGVIEKIGAKISRFKIGDAVYAFFTLKEEGGYAQFAVAKENEVSRKPQSLTFEQAAAVPAAGSTAWQALVDEGKLDYGQTVLIHGGSGGVGHMAIQIAKARGAHVIATASTANQDFLKQLGVDQAIDYTTTKFETVAKDVDLVLDAVGGDTLTRSYGVVKKGGIIISIAGNLDDGQLKKHGIRGVSISSAPETDTFDQLTRLIDAKKLTPLVSQTLPLQEAAKAQEQIQSRHTRGKIVLRVSE
ncbi:MAG: NADP-dependent oxidoreductase [Verrucomicrobiota bacterium]|nr:NADP-dependent oxidoreductase [Verrucomicrobiota bacterium]